MAATPSNTRHKKPPSRDAFLEAFRDLGQDFAGSLKNDLLAPSVKDVKNTLFNSRRSQPPMDTDFPGFQPKQPDQLSELEHYRQMARRSELLRHQEQTLFSNRDRETQKQIVLLQDEIQSMAKATGDVAKEIGISVSQIAPNEKGSSYLIAFLIRLRTTLRKMKGELQESSLWLSAWTKKSKKKNYYWGQAKKSGSSFLLHSDRTAATQAG